MVTEPRDVLSAAVDVYLTRKVSTGGSFIESGRPKAVYANLGAIVVLLVSPEMMAARRGPSHRYVWMVAAGLRCRA